MLTVHCTDLSSTSTSSNSLGDDESSTGYRQPIRLVDQLRTHLRDCSNEATATTSTTVTFASTALMSTMSILAIWLSSSSSSYSCWGGPRTPGSLFFLRFFPSLSPVSIDPHRARAPITLEPWALRWIALTHWDMEQLDAVQSRELFHSLARFA